MLIKILRYIRGGIDSLNYWLGRGVSWLSVLLVLIVCVNVVMRYVFHCSFVFLQEFEWHLFAALFLLGGGYTLLKDGHVRVDIFYQRLGGRGKAWLNLVGVLLFLLPGCYLVIFTGLPFAVSSFQMGEGSPDPGGIPYRYLIKTMIPAGFILLALQGVSMAITSFLTLCRADDKNEKRWR